MWLLIPSITFYILHPDTLSILKNNIIGTPLIIMNHLENIMYPFSKKKKKPLVDWIPLQTSAESKPCAKHLLSVWLCYFIPSLCEYWDAAYQNKNTTICSTVLF